jgi:hypothetical protein
MTERNGQLVFVPIFGPNHVANLDGIPHSKVWGLRERDDSLVVHVLHAESVGYNLHHLETSRPLNIFSSEASHMRVIEDGDPDLPDAVCKALALLALAPETLELGEAN